MIKKLKLLRSHNGFMRYFRNTSWLMGERVLRMCVGLFIGVWIARYLGPEQFGLLSYAQSFVFIFITIASLGLDSIVVRELLKNESKRDVILGTSFTLKLIASILVLPIIAVSVLFTSNDSYTNLLIFILASATIFQSFNVIDFYYQSKVMSKYVAFANTFSLLLSSIMKVIFILNEFPLIAFVSLTVFDACVVSIGLCYFYIRKNTFKRPSWYFDWNVARSLMKDSCPLMLGGLVLLIQSRIDQIMLKEMLGNVEVGYYSVALRLIELFGFIPILLKSSLYPSIQNAKIKSEEQYLDRLLNFYRLNFILFLIVAIPIYFFSEKIVILVFGVEYQPAGILLGLMAFRLFFTNMGTARGVFIITENLIKYSIISMIIGTISNIILNLILIPKYGSVGAVIATIGSFFITIFLIDFIYIKIRKNMFRQVLSILTFYKVKIN